MKTKIIRLTLALLLIACSSFPALAQTASTGAGSPSGACVSGSIYSDSTTGLLWTCKVGWQLPTKLTLTSTYTNTTTSMTDVPGLSFPVVANTQYGLICFLTYQTSSSVTAAQFTFSGPVTPTALNYSAVIQTNVGTSTAFYSPAVATTNFGAPLSTNGGNLATTNMSAIMYMGLISGSTAGTVQVRAAAQITGTITIQAGSFCAIQ